MKTKLITRSIVVILSCFILLGLIVSCNDSDSGLFEAAYYATYQTTYKIYSIIGKDVRKGEVTIYTATNEGIVSVNNNGSFTRFANPGTSSTSVLAFYASAEGDETYAYYFNTDDKSRITGYKKVCITNSEIEAVDISKDQLPYRFITLYTTDAENYTLILKDDDNKSVFIKKYSLSNIATADDILSDFTELSGLDDSLYSTLSLKGDGYFSAGEAADQPYRLDGNQLVAITGYDSSSGSYYIRKLTDDIMIDSNGRIYALSDDNLTYTSKRISSSYTSTSPNMYTTLKLSGGTYDGATLIFIKSSSSLYIYKDGSLSSITVPSLSSIYPIAVYQKLEDPDQLLLINGNNVTGILNLSTKKYTTSGIELSDFIE